MIIFYAIKIRKLFIDIKYILRINTVLNQSVSNLPKYIAFTSTTLTDKHFD